jgi:DNA-binding response OmpR family regulator
MAMILYIDDDEYYGWLVKRLLGLYSLAVETAGDGLEGIRKAREQRPDLIMVNVYLPRLDGLELIQQLRGEMATRVIPIVVVSPLPSQHSQRLARDMNVQDVISQPLQFDELTGIVYKYLGQSSAHGWAAHSLMPAASLAC